MPPDLSAQAPSPTDPTVRHPTARRPCRRRLVRADSGMSGRGPSRRPRNRTPPLPTVLTRSDYGLRMPKKVKWGLVLIAQLPITYVLIAANRRFTFDAEQAQTLGQIFEGVLWLLIAAGWIGGSVLGAWGCWELQQNRSRSRLHRRLEELGQLRDAGTITRTEHDTLRQQALTHYAASW